MLVPQALEGVAAVGLAVRRGQALVRRRRGARGGRVFALTPVAALMFRFNNPDALLVLMLVAGAYCLVRALERAGTRWMLAAGAMIGFAFLAKMMQAFLVLPAFALVYLIAAPTTLRRRIGQLLAGGAARARQRRLVGGDRRALAGRLAAVHRRLARQQHPQPDRRLQRPRAHLRQRRRSGGGGGGGGANFSGATGPLRLFNDLMGGQASWLLPGRAARARSAGCGHAAARRAPTARAPRCCCGAAGCSSPPLVFSFGQGVIHTYYTVALAPAIGALVAIGAALLLVASRDRSRARLLAALAVGASAGWAYVAARAHAQLGAVAAPADRDRRRAGRARPAARARARAASARRAGA